jgi:hypothetical protein
MLVDPSELDEVIESMPEIVENCRSSGVATEAAIISGLAPGRPALTCMVGKSTFGRSLTGSVRYATIPKTTIPSMTSVVMTGRRMKSSVMFMTSAFSASALIGACGTYPIEHTTDMSICFELEVSNLAASIRRRSLCLFGCSSLLPLSAGGEKIRGRKTRQR